MDSGCLQAANVFLRECRYLSELREVLQHTPNAAFRLPGFTFDDVLRDYIDVVNACKYLFLFSNMSFFSKR